MEKQTNNALIDELKIISAKNRFLERRVEKLENALAEIKKISYAFLTKEE